MRMCTNKLSFRNDKNTFKNDLGGDNQVRNDATFAGNDTLGTKTLKHTLYVYQGPRIVTTIYHAHKKLA